MMGLYMIHERLCAPKLDQLIRVHSLLREQLPAKLRNVTSTSFWHARNPRCAATKFKPSVLCSNHPVTGWQKSFNQTHSQHPPRQPQVHQALFLSPPAAEYGCPPIRDSFFCKPSCSDSSRSYSLSRPCTQEQAADTTPHQCQRPAPGAATQHSKRHMPLSPVLASSPPQGFWQQLLPGPLLSQAPSAAAACRLSAC